jgi:predicted transcriptional regulator
MVSDRIMKEFRNKLNDKPQTVRQLARKLGRDARNTLTVLEAMRDLGICEQVDLPPAKGPRQAKKGWRLTCQQSTC